MTVFCFLYRLSVFWWGNLSRREGMKKGLGGLWESPESISLPFGKVSIFWGFFSRKEGGRFAESYLIPPPPPVALPPLFPTSHKLFFFFSFFLFQKNRKKKHSRYDYSALSRRPRLHSIFFFSSSFKYTHDSCGVRCRGRRKDSSPQGRQVKKRKTKFRLQRHLKKPV